jgi:hypothetical protein
MGHTDAADLLQATLDEEKAADEKLTALAEGGINQEAADGAHQGNEEEDSPPQAKSAAAARSRQKRTMEARRHR